MRVVGESGGGRDGLGEQTKAEACDQAKEKRFHR
jgi:hypothetical protein